MALITDPDSLNQGTNTAVSDHVITTPGTGADSQFTSSSNMPALASGEFFEVRDHSEPLANGLWQVVTVNTSTSDYEVDKVSSGAVPATQGSEATNFYGLTGASDEKSVHFDTLAEKIYLLEQGNLSVDGVIMLALHSFIKEEWKADQLLIDSGAFPMVGISFAAGQWEFGEDPSGNNSDWQLIDVPGFSIDSRRLIRNAGFDEKDNTGLTTAKYFGVKTLGTFEDTLDQAEYYFGNDTGVDNSTNYAFTDAVNEAVQYYDFIGDLTGDSPDFPSTSTITRTTGSFLTDGFVVGGQVEVTNSTSNDGTFVLTGVAALTLTVTGTPFSIEAWGTTTIAYDQSNAFTTFLRIRDADPTGKLFAQSDLAAAGETAISSKVIPFGLTNSSDVDITSTDGTVSGSSPWTEVRLRYLAAAYNREVDSATPRNFGVVIDVGTYSESNGAAATTSRWDSAAFALGAGEALADYNGGTLVIHEGVNQGSHTINGTPVDNAGTLEVTLVGTPLTVAGSSESFTVDRLTPLTADKNEIYEKIQYQLRQGTDIDDGTGTVIGKMVGELASFSGPNITFGLGNANPAGGGSGVIVEGFDANDTNTMTFVDNGGTPRTFPFVAAGTLNFNTNLTTDTDPEYWLYFQYTDRTNLTDGATVGPSTDTMDLESPGSNLPALVADEYIRISGFANANNNGLFIVTVVNVSTQDYTVRRVDGEDCGAAESGVTIDVDENPFNSPDAIIVDDNGGADIVGAASSASIAFDFDYDNNVQGGRTAATPAVCVLKAIGLETGQFVQTQNLTITRTTGLSFVATAALERNFSNPV